MLTRARINQLEALAQEYLGTPWVDQGSYPEGFDCWSWVHFCLTRIGYDVPGNLWMAKRHFIQVPLPGQPGDVLHFWPPGGPREHLGLKLRETRFSDCNRLGRGVMLQDLSRDPWRVCLQGIWRFEGARTCD
jgi:cell wall-associated NlpC family hydrolase